MSSSFGMSVTSVVTAVILTLSFCDACFIRNCPKGGKRSLEGSSVARRECTKCGPDNAGQCVGPTVCCGQDFGCLMGTAETAVCQQENQIQTPCLVKGDVCGARDSGNCVADGICCDSESCAVNERCNAKQTDGMLDVQKTSRGDIVRLIHKLLRERDYD